ncbi:ABC transporter permease [bacterium]|nr:ABC transporter permease [bacterium]
MGGAMDISTKGLLFAAIFLVALLALVWLKGGRKILIKSTVSMIRMTIQLSLVGIYLTWMFKINNPWLNVGWIVVMIGAANLSILNHSGLSKRLFPAIFMALAITLFVVLSWFMVFVFMPENPTDARLLIPIAGMLLGNSMNRTIVTTERFYSSILQNEDTFAVSLAMGATVREAAMPFFRESYRAGLAPVLANYAAMGLVSIPGMMTGAILGGSSPSIAVKYQIVIVVAIFAATEIATLLSILFILSKAFLKNGMPNRDMFT